MYHSVLTLPIKKLSLLGWWVAVPISAFLVGYGFKALAMHDAIQEVVLTSQTQIEQAQERAGEARAKVDSLKDKVASLESKH